MISMNKEAPERQDIEALLPWHAAGTLSRRDSDRVERALAGDGELARRFELVREELSETIHLNETLGAPSARAMEKLFAAIDAETPVVKKQSFNLVARVVEFMSSFSPRTLAYAASAAVIALLLQTVVLSTLMVRDHRGQNHELASFDNGHRYVFVNFTPQATLADVTRFLNVNRAVLVGGPKPGGLYELRLTQSPMAQDDFEVTVQRMRSEKKIVTQVVPKS
jgi:hypothetical protein